MRNETLGFYKTISIWTFHVEGQLKVFSPDEANNIHTSYKNLYSTQHFFPFNILKTTLNVIHGN